MKASFIPWGFSWFGAVGRMLNIVGYLKPQGCLQPLARTWDAGAGSRRILPSPALPLGSSPRGRARQPAPCNLLVCHFAHSIATVKLHLQSLGRTVGKGPPSHASGLCWQTRMGVKLFSNRFWGAKKYTLPSVFGWSGNDRPWMYPQHNPGHF